MQVIITKIIPATNRRQTRIMVKGASSSLYVPYDHELSAERNHTAALVNAVNKLENAFTGWAGEWVAGHSATGETYWVNTTATAATQRAIIGKRPSKV